MIKNKEKNLSKDIKWKQEEELIERLFELAFSVDMPSDSQYKLLKLQAEFERLKDLKFLDDEYPKEYEFFVTFR